MTNATSKKSAKGVKKAALKRDATKEAKPHKGVPSQALTPTLSQEEREQRELGASRNDSKIRFSATLLRPRRGGQALATKKAAPRHGESLTWTFLTLPIEVSSKLPSRGQTTVEGALNGFPFRATLEPDGQGGHWLKVDRKMREAAGAEPNDVVALEIAPVAEEPEPKVPADLRKALAAAPPKAREAWLDITPAARRDFIHWIVAAKQAETRARRVANACDMLAKGKRRPCCFDRSGMYSKSLACPIADNT